MSNRILLTAFRGSSAELLISDWNEYPQIILPNDKIRDSELVIAALEQENYDYIISFGQKPNIRDKVYVETMGKQGAVCIETSFPWNRLRHLCQERGLSIVISTNAGTSFCNQLYYNGLQYIQQNDINTKMIFIHIPFEKNISDMKCFRLHMQEVLKQI